MPTSFHTPAHIHVCSLDVLDDVVATTKASHVLTVINQWSIPDTPPGIAAENHLKIAVNDIEEEHHGLIAPNVDHIIKILEFVELWERQQPLVVHCLAGISRSTAAAFIALCAMNSNTDEITLARYMRKASRTASPNRLMISLADRQMSRNGRMIEAIEHIGKGEALLEAKPFSIPSSIA